MDEDDSEIISTFTRSCLTEGCLYPLGLVIITGVGALLWKLFAGTN